MKRTRAYIAVDVDGVLNALSVRPPAGWTSHEGGMLYVRPDLGPKLLALAAKHGAQLIWLTTWEGRANQVVGPIYGLPKLPVVSLRDNDWRQSLGHVKATALRRWLRNKPSVPVVWFDDETDADEQIQLALPLRGRAIQTNPNLGLTARNLSAADRLLTQLIGGSNDNPAEPATAA